jgi:hypothetical protein
MAKPVLITCPKTGRPVPTGLMMSEEVFARESNFANVPTVECRECGETHAWTKKEAYLGSTSTFLRRTK